MPFYYPVARQFKSSAKECFKIHIQWALQYFECFIFAEVSYVPGFHSLLFYSYNAKPVPTILKPGKKSHVNIIFYRNKLKVNGRFPLAIFIA